MWDNAPLLRGIANTLFTFSACAALYDGVFYATHLPGLFPLHSVHLDKAPEHVEANKVLQVVRNDVNGNFFTVDIESLRKSLEQLPWVRNVGIRREFSDHLVVQLEEHQALARWNGNALVNLQGEVFVASSEQVLPEFSGQEEMSEEITQHYAQFDQQLATLKLQIAKLTLSPRHAWQLRLNNGMVLELGSEEMQQRLERFVEAYPNSLAPIQGRVKYVDLRYRNGFAVGWLNGLAKQG